MIFLLVPGLSVVVVPMADVARQKAIVNQRLGSLALQQVIQLLVRQIAVIIHAQLMPRQYQYFMYVLNLLLVVTRAIKIRIQRNFCYIYLDFELKIKIVFFFSIYFKIFILVLNLPLF
jgi:hypothetical protein